MANSFLFGKFQTIVTLLLYSVVTPIRNYMVILPPILTCLLCIHSPSLLSIPFPSPAIYPLSLSCYPSPFHHLLSLPPFVNCKLIGKRYLIDHWFYEVQIETDLNSDQSGPPISGLIQVLLDGQYDSYQYLYMCTVH
jgi:hypothetical protein